MLARTLIASYVWIDWIKAMKKYWQFLITFVLVILLSFIAHPGVYSQIDESAGDKIDGFESLDPEYMDNDERP